jgi:RimJ/RimL family protein N-acetyltransferase
LPFVGRLDQLVHQLSGGDVADPAALFAGSQPERDEQNGTCRCRVLSSDPQLMAELGGPRPREAIERTHAKSLALAAEGRCWPLKIIPDEGSSPAGGVDVFESSHEDEAIYEIGWMILPEFQDRGIASQAVREVLERARVERMFGQIHAFPAVTNGPSNKVCEKNGFTNLGECEVEFAGRGLRCNHWRIDLF